MTPEIVAFVVLVRCVLMMLVVLVVGGYHNPKARYRPAISIIAALFAGSLFGWSAYSAISTFVHLQPASASFEVFALFLSVVLLALVVGCRGNLAKILNVWSKAR